MELQTPDDQVEGKRFGGFRLERTLVTFSLSFFLKFSFRIHLHLDLDRNEELHPLAAWRLEGLFGRLARFRLLVRNGRSAEGVTR